MKVIQRSISQLFRDQSGVAMIIVALSMFMLIGFTAIVVDAGGLYVEKGNLQKALDAAVLGGAQRLKVSEADAKSTAIDLASKNGFIVTEDKVTTGINFIEIDKTVNKQLTFARVLGFSNANVQAYARAEIINSLIEGDGVIPVGLVKGDYAEGASYALNEEPGEGNSGNYGFLAIDGTGASTLGQGIQNGSKTTVKVDMLVETEPGMNWGKVEEGFDYRITQDSGKEHCSSSETADNTCKRVVIVPLIDSFDDAKGRSNVKIVGFAAFWIESISKHEAKGRFIEIVRGGMFEPGEDFGIYGVKLVK